MTPYTMYAFLIVFLPMLLLQSPRGAMAQDYASYIHKSPIFAPQFLHEKLVPTVEKIRYDLLNSNSYETDDRLAGSVGSIMFSFPKLPNVSEACRVHTEATIRNLWSSFWALELIDASAKIPSGFLQGDFKWVGSYSECLAVRATFNNTDLVATNVSTTFQGKYCTVAFDTKPTSLNVAICIPSSCTGDDVQSAITSFFQNSTAKVFNCQVDEPTKFDSTAIGVIFMFSYFGLLITVATCWDVYYVLKYKKAYKEEKAAIQCTTVRLILSFSLYTNTIKMFDIDTKNDNNVGVIHGIRFLSMSWVILGHTYYVGGLATPIKNAADSIASLHSMVFLGIENGTFSVDSFFFLTGFLIAYTFFKAGDKVDNIKMFLGRFYIHRYIRLTPLYAAIIAWAAGFWFLQLSGPAAPQYESFQNDCRKYWWRHLLYINNFFDDGQVCVPVSWYLAADMQFYVVSPLILYALKKNEKYGYAVIAAFFLATFIASGVILGVNDYPGINFLIYSDPDKLIDMQKYYYIRSYCRMGPFLVGIITGYLVGGKYKTQIEGDTYEMNKILVGVCWFAAAVFSFLILYGVQPYFANEKSLSSAVSVLYGTFARTVWAIGVAWMTFACITGYGGIISDILSLKVFIPLSRLTYGTYLVQQFVLLLFFVGIQVELFYDSFFMFYMYMGSIALSLATAYIFAIVFESPILAIEKIVFNKLDGGALPTSGDRSCIIDQEATGSGENRGAAERPVEQEAHERTSMIGKAERHERQEVHGGSSRLGEAEGPEMGGKNKRSSILSEGSEWKDTRVAELQRSY